MEKGLGEVEVGEGLAKCVVLTKRVKAEVTDVCSAAFVVIEVGDVDVDLTRAVVGVEVWVRAVSVVENVEVCEWAVDVFGVSSKSASDKGKKVHISIISIDFSNFCRLSIEP